MNKSNVEFYFRVNILDKLPENIRDKVAIAGGAIRDKLVDAEIKDYDLFVQDWTTEELLMSFLKEKGKEGKINGSTANYTFEGKWVQVIRNMYFNIESTELIDSFDFTICQAMITNKGGLVVGEHFWESLSTKHLMINKIYYPLSTLERLQKYIKKGYTACNGTLLEIATAINDMRRDVFTPGAEKDGLQSVPTTNTLAFYSDGSPRFMGVD